MYLCLYMGMVTGVQNRGIRPHPELVLQAVMSTLTWVLGTKLGFSARAG